MAGPAGSLPAGSLPAGLRPAGFLIAAPASGSGKTTVTLALLRHLRDMGRRVSSIKVGPDYIDPGFHAAASGRACFNLDAWAMRSETLEATLALAGGDADLIVGEGVMGLFDGAAATDARGFAAGSTASLAALLGWPVVLVVDCRGMGASLAALLRGFAEHRAEVVLGAVVLNAVASERHEALLRTACREAGLPVLAVVKRDERLVRPSRHLGLVQAGEDPALERFLDHAARSLGATLDAGVLQALPRPARRMAADSADLEPERHCRSARPLAPLGQHIAVARDLAFSFTYPLVLEGWRAAGAEISFFSPLAGEGPAAQADAAYLPGGYPELHGAALAASRGFAAEMQALVARGGIVYGECGGYMVLGRVLEDKDGIRHPMLGLLPLESSFREPRRRLGYRRAELLAEGPLGAAGTGYRAHEFHYASARGAGLQAAGAQAGAEEALFRFTNAAGEEHGFAGLRIGRVMGSFLHLIDRESEPAAAFSG